MTEITAPMVKELRDRTLAGFTDCKKALAECEGDLDKAAEFLRKKGLISAAKKSGRTAAAGLVHSYIHAGGKIGVLLEVNCETDFVARTDSFVEFVKDVSMQIAAMESAMANAVRGFPKKRSLRNARFVPNRPRTAANQRTLSRKSSMVRFKKWYTEVCLLEQPFVKENKKDIKTLLAELIATVGENCKVRRFIRWEVGEGIQVSKKDFADEIRELAQ